MRVAVTGVTSFTGFHIASELSRAGYEVYGLCAQEISQYTGLKRERLTELGKTQVLLEGGILAQENMAHWVRKKNPQLWIHHHHWMEDYRLNSYDEIKALKFGVEPISELLKSLQGSSDFRGIVFSGTCFEPTYAGKSKEEVTPYARSKELVWENLREKCRDSGIPLSKVVITDPIGPMENEDRLIPVMLRNASLQKPLIVKTPRLTYDRIPGFVLGRVYAELARELEIKKAPRIARPQGKVMNLLDWIHYVRLELLERRLGFSSVEVIVEESAVDLKSFNTEPVSIDWDFFWDNYAEWARSRIPRMSD